MSSERTFFIGSYSIPSPWTGTPRAHGDGISRATLDLATGAMRLGPATPAINPSFLVSDRGRGLLWAITEPETNGDVIAFAVSGEGDLTELGRVETAADAPCHLAVDAAHQLAFVSHYHGTSVALIQLEDLIPQRSLARYIPEAHAGRDAQATPPRPHASVRVGADELLVADAGLDLVLLYRIITDGDDSSLELVASVQLEEGTGPRHIAWSNQTQTAYVSNQNVGSVSVIDRVAGDDGIQLRVRSTVASGTVGRDVSIPSEIALHPNGRALYMANRLDDSLSIFRISPEGDVVLHNTIDVQGKNPRHFRLTEHGEYLLIANQDSDDVVSFSVSADGLDVAWTGHRLDVATPTCVTFW